MTRRNNRFKIGTTVFLEKNTPKKNAPDKSLRTGDLL